MFKFPWDVLKAGTLRALCQDIGFSSNRKRDDMILFLTTVEEQGVEVALELSKQQFEPSTNNATHERRAKRSRKTSDTGPQKMVTRNRGKRTTSYLAIILAGRSRRKPLSQRKKRTTTARPASTVTRKFHGVVLPSLGRMSSRDRKRKRQESPQDFGGPPESDSDIDCPHEIDDGEGVVQLALVNNIAKANEAPIAEENGQEDVVEPRHENASAGNTSEATDNVANATQTNNITTEAAHATADPAPENPHGEGAVFSYPPASGFTGVVNGTLLLPIPQPLTNLHRDT